MKWQKFADAMKAFYEEHGYYPAFGETARRRAKPRLDEFEEGERSKECSGALPPHNPLQQVRRNRRKPWK